MEVCFFIYIQNSAQVTSNNATNANKVTKCWCSGWTHVLLWGSRFRLLACACVINYQKYNNNATNIFIIICIVGRAVQEVAQGKLSVSYTSNCGTPQINYMVLTNPYNSSFKNLPKFWSTKTFTCTRIHPNKSSANLEFQCPYSNSYKEPFYWPTPPRYRLKHPILHN